MVANFYRSLYLLIVVVLYAYAVCSMCAAAPPFISRNIAHTVMHTTESRAKLCNFTYSIPRCENLEENITHDTNVCVSP